MSERVICAINMLQKNFEVIIINAGQSSFNTDYAASQNYKKYVNDNFKKENIFNTPAADKHSSTRSTKNQMFIFDLVMKAVDEKTHAVIFDDSRSSSIYSKIYEYCKEKGCKVYANCHGNTNNLGLIYGFKGKKFYDKLFVLGNNDINCIDNLGYNSSVCIPAGIPANDALSNSALTKEYIIVVVNMVLQKQWGNISILDYAKQPRSMCKKTIDQMNLLSLQKKTGKKVIFKLKHRLTSPQEEEIKFLKNAIDKRLNYEIVYNVEDENNFIRSAYCVLSYGSTMMFKPIQLGIPTIIYKELGILGVFSKYAGSINLADSYDHILERNFMKYNASKFLKNSLAGGTTFDASKIYVNSI